jgi:hypothetical protein
MINFGLNTLIIATFRALVALLPELAANDPIFAFCDMTDAGMQILLVWIKYTT